MGKFFKNLRETIATALSKKLHASVSWYNKKRIYPIDTIGQDIISESRTNGLKLATPVIIVLIVCIMAAAI